MKKRIIYKTTNLINLKIYIGQDSRNNPNYYGSGKLLIRAIKKYGKENFKKETIEECKTKDELDEKEIYWIKHYNSKCDKIGYNILDGGSYMSDETKLKIGNSLKGRTLSKEHIKKVSENHADVSGVKNPMYGKFHSEDVKRILSEKNLGRKASEKQRIRMSIQKQGEKNSNAKLTEKQVLKIRKIRFEENVNMKEISKMFNVSESCINKIVSYRTWKKI